MNITLTYDEENIETAVLAINVLNITEIIRELRTYLRNEIKHNTNHSAEQITTYETIREKLYELIDDSSVSYYI